MSLKAGGAAEVVTRKRLTNLRKQLRCVVVSE